MRSWTSFVYPPSVTCVFMHEKEQKWPMTERTPCFSTRKGRLQYVLDRSQQCQQSPLYFDAPILFFGGGLLSAVPTSTELRDGVFLRDDPPRACGTVGLQRLRPRARPAVTTGKRFRMGADLPPTEGSLQETDAVSRGLALRARTGRLNLARSDDSLLGERGEEDANMCFDRRNICAATPASQKEVVQIRRALCTDRRVTRTGRAFFGTQSRPGGTLGDPVHGARPGVANCAGTDRS
jgi:hypothetical protein